MKLASGTIQVGDSEGASKLPIAQGKKKETLEVSVGRNVKFPVAVTLLMHFPGMAPDAKPEVFNFKFDKFTDESGPRTSALMGSMKM